MDHRRAGGQGLQVAQNGGRVGLAAPPAPFLARTRSKQLVFREDGECRLGAGQRPQFRRLDHRERSVAGEKLLPAVHRDGAQSVRTQHLDQHFAPARGIDC